MRASAWAALAILALLAAGLLLAAAFTRFDGGEPPQQPAALREYERGLYADARWSAVLGLAACFALLGGAACAQRAWRTRTSS